LARYVSTFKDWRGKDYSEFVNLELPTTLTPPLTLTIHHWSQGACEFVLDDTLRVEDLFAGEDSDDPMPQK
jgi:hypothetical protein